MIVLLDNMPAPPPPAPRRRVAPRPATHRPDRTMGGGVDAPRVGSRGSTAEAGGVSRLTDRRHASDKVRPRPAAGPVHLAGAQSGPGASAGRDRYLDVLKALATVAVVLGHWLTTALVTGADGSWRVATPLAAAPGLAWVTVAVQPLTVFFAIGGLTSAQSLWRARARGETFGSWLARRLHRLLGPASAAIGVFIVACTGLALAGVPLGIIRTIVIACVQPLWFVAVYVVIAAVTAAADRLDARWGWRVPLALAGCVAVIDFLRYGPLAPHLPGWIGLINLLPGWLFAYQCGLAAVRRPLRVRGAWALAGAGLATYLIALACGYPPTPMGVAVHGRINSHPPSLVVVACAAMFLGVLWALEPTLRRLVARSTALGRLTDWVSPRSMALLCWHMAALVAVVNSLALAETWAGHPGMVGALADPATGEFWLSRLAILPLAGGVLLLVARGRTTQPVGLVGRDAQA